VAEETIADVDASSHWLGRTVTEISKASRFWEDPAEHQSCAFRTIRRGSNPPSRARAWKLADRETAA
jgi:hypothetical protein